MAYEPLHHKYRPQTFAQLVGQDAIATTLANALQQGRIAPAYLFCGPRGTGKTSSARILAKSLNCTQHPDPSPNPCGQCDTCRAIANGSALDFVEIDAASNTGVDNIRELIERAQFAPVQCRYKVYVIDECHMLSVAAFNALLKTLEEPPERVVFVLATTDPQRVLPTIISRCQRFDYRRIPLEAMVNHLQVIAQQEAIPIEPDAVRLVAQIAQGGLRDAESLLDQLSLLEPPITAEKVWDLVGAVPERDLLNLVRAIATNDGALVLEQARKLMDRGREPLIVLQNLAGFYRDLLIAKAAGSRQDLVAITPSTWAEMQTLAQGLDIPVILAGQQHLRTVEVQVKNTTQPRLWLEVALLGLLPDNISSQSPDQPPLTTAPHSAPAIKPPQSAPPASPTPAASTQPSPPAASPLQSAAPAPPSPPVAATPAPSPAPATAAATPAAPNSTDLPQLWQKILSVLQPFGTRALMNQQGTLLEFDGQKARIGISSKPLFKMAQGRISNVEAAFEAVLNQPVKVSLDVMPEGHTPPPANADHQPVAPSSSPSPPPAPAPSATHHPSSHTSRPSETTERAASETETVSVAPSPPTNNNSPPMPPVTIDSDLERAVKSFAQFFNGQIIDLGEEPPTGSAQFSGEPDKDVPF